MRSFAPKHQQFRYAHPVTQRMKPESHSNLAKQLTLAAMSLGYGVVQLDVTIVNTALNSIGSALGGGVSELQWVVSTYKMCIRDRPGLCGPNHAVRRNGSFDAPKC